jgi:uncharacterized membrane protein
MSQSDSTTRSFLNHAAVALTPAEIVRSTNHPALISVAEKRAADVQLRVADAITKFAGSMMFVYVHIVLFAVWMLFVETNPWPTLTLGVSLEAIFLSTFVMIGQNRQAAYQQAKADHDFVANEQELRTNTDLTKAIHEMTLAVHEQVCLNGPKGHHVTGTSAPDG